MDGEGGEGLGGGGVVTVKVFSQDRVLQRFVEQFFEDEVVEEIVKGFLSGRCVVSTALRGAET